MVDKAVYPCEGASVEQLDKMLQEIMNRTSTELKSFLFRSDSQEVHWENVRHLRIIGDSNVVDELGFQEDSDLQGVYLNTDGSWLLLVERMPRLEVYLCRCSETLESLKITDAGITVLPGLGSLTRLTMLGLSRCFSLTALPGLGSLTQLTQLDLSDCCSIAELPWLGSLTQLTSLHLSGCSSLTVLLGLGSLTQLTSLDPSRCSSLTALPGLGRLTQLTELNLSGCSSLTALPGLRSLTQLTLLRLYRCSSLTELDLSGCSSLTALPGLETLTQLTKLDFSGCSSLAELPAELRHMESLRLLNLRHLKLRELPGWLPEIAESFYYRGHSSLVGKSKAAIHLYGTTVETIPDMSIFDQPYEMVADFFRNRRLGQTHPLNEIKVVFLGDGEAGKSHTIARLMNDGGEPDYLLFDGQSTPGIVIRNKEYHLGDRKITVHYWDFGGQEIMHSMHRIFLTGRTMYVILLNARDDTQSDRAKYWLHNVKSFAPDAPVLLVLNKIDQNENASVDERDLRGRYDKLTRVVKLSAKCFSKEKFNDCFTNVLLAEIHKTGFLDAQWPTTWTMVKERLENMTTHYIMGSEYQALCRECHVDENRKNLLHWFNDLGVSFCYCDDYKLEDYVILRPDWITNALYIILFNRLEGACNGLIPHRSIYNLLRNAHDNPTIRCTLPQASYNTSDIGYVLGIMRKFNISFADGHDNEFIPMLCQQNSMVDIQYYCKDEEILEFNMKFDYLPNNLLHRLMVERYTELDMATVWRTGTRLELKELGYSAVIVIDSNTLRFFIRHTDSMHRPNTYLTMLKAHVDGIVAKMGLKAPINQLIYKLDGKRDEFDLDNLKLRMKVGQTHELSVSHEKMIPIKDILNQSAPEDTQKCTEPTTGPTNIYNYHGKITNVYGTAILGDHVEGDKVDGIQNKHDISQNLTTILDKLITENIQSKKDFVDHLLSQLENSKDEDAREYFVNDLLTKLEASEDKTTREIADNAKTDPQKKGSLLTFLRNIVSGTSSAASFLADAPDAVKTLTAITTAISAVAAKYGPEIAEFLSKF